eukprot:m.38441 g.38441  ORF g.38441 m.38441 type:complete len:456 (+) comp17917_c0_seq1:220-1587(+)
MPQPSIWRVLIGIVCGVAVMMVATLQLHVHSVSTSQGIATLKLELAQAQNRVANQDAVIMKLKSKTEVPNNVNTSCSLLPQSPTMVTMDQAIAMGNTSINVDGYLTVDAVETAVLNGVDVRLIQDHIPLRQHTAHKVPDAVDIRLDYDTCIRTINQGKGVPPQSQHPAPKYVHWLHIPKSGTSFGSMLYGLVCQAEWSSPTSPYTGEPCDYCGAKAKQGIKWDTVLHPVIDFSAFPYCNWNITTSTPRANFRNHVPLPLDHRPQQNWWTMGLFRDPRRRLVSGWNDGKHANGFDPKHLSSFQKTTTSLEQYVRHPSIRNCVTKMLVGAYCARNRNLTQHAFSEARRRLINMAFVGLTDNFDASACLFCRMYNITPQRFMFGKRARARPMEDQVHRALPGGGERVGRDEWTTLLPSVDPLDFELWTIAQDIFMARLQEYGLYEIDYRMIEKGIKYS